MARTATLDPLDKFRWTVRIDGFSKVGFTSVTTPEYAIQTKEYAEGGAHLTPRQVIDSISYKPVTLARGATADTSFNKWATAFYDLVTNNYAINQANSEKIQNASSFLEGVNAALNAAQDNGASPVMSSRTQPKKYRRKVIIEHTNSVGQVEVVYILHHAFPIVYKPASDFDASADDSVSIETLTLAYDSFEVRYTGIAGALSTIASKNNKFNIF